MTSFSSALCPPPPRPPNAAPERPDMDGILCNRVCGEGSVGTDVKEDLHFAPLSGPTWTASSATESVGRGAKTMTVRASEVAEEERRCVHLSGGKVAQQASLRGQRKV